MHPSPQHLPHGWTLSLDFSVPQTLVREFVRPAIRAVPSAMAHRLGSCRISLRTEVGARAASKWTATHRRLNVTVAISEVEQHDVAMELLLCVGQALWSKLSKEEYRAYWMLLGDEINAGVEGEIDEQALDEKRSLFASRSHANSATL